MNEFERPAIPELNEDFEPTRYTEQPTAGEVMTGSSILERLTHADRQKLLALMGGWPVEP